MARLARLACDTVSKIANVACAVDSVVPYSGMARSNLIRVPVTFLAFRAIKAVAVVARVALTGPVVKSRRAIALGLRIDVTILAWLTRRAWT